MLFFSQRSLLTVIMTACLRPSPGNPQPCAQRLPGRLGEARPLLASPAPQPGFSRAVQRSPGEGRKANDSLPRQLVTSPRSSVPCRTGATCCHSGSCSSLHFSCSERALSPREAVTAFLQVWACSCSRTKRRGLKGHSSVLPAPGLHKTSKDLPQRGACDTKAKIPPHASYTHDTCRYTCLRTHVLTDV